MKQRDIMIALTQRLNERDDAICALHDELDTCEERQRVLEERLDVRTQQLIHLENAVVMHSNSDGGGGGITTDLIQALDWEAGPHPRSGNPQTAALASELSSNIHNARSSKGVGVVQSAGERGGSKGPNSMAAGPGPAPELLVSYPQFQPHWLLTPTVYSSTEDGERGRGYR
ncbi:unnamed protein product, partial [Choristocarpus tenellus]